MRVEHSMTEYWFSCNKFTCLVSIDSNGIITKNSAPIVHRFISQPAKNLVNWMKSLGGFKYEQLTKPHSKVG